ncbi:MAG: S-adenosylmethionine:tRNA ribosyltransferase-isomerase [Bacteroidia bacterium]
MNSNPEELSIEDFSYELPDERIAKFPLAQRDESKILIYKEGEIQESVFSKIDDLLSSGDLLVANQTRVVQARLVFATSSAARLELFCLEPGVEGLDIQQAMFSRKSVLWKCLVGNARKWKEDEVLELRSDENYGFILQARLVEKLGAESIISLEWSPEDLSFAEVLEIAGRVPLPPYLKREAEESDQERYQTVYAINKGSVAAPTAGLHFTDDVLERLKSKGISEAFLTLHVGAGTFKPVKSERMKDHDMHSEEIIADLDLLEMIASSEGNLIAVGTTSLRSLESIYWTAVKLMRKESDELKIEVNQWYPYQVPAHELPDRKQAFNFLVHLMKEKGLRTITGSTRLIIAPGYIIKTADILITNFHQPKSTLLLLVSACIGEDWKRVYNYALVHDFRFLSYGDSSILFIKK